VQSARRKLKPFKGKAGAAFAAPALRGKTIGYSAAPLKAARRL